MRFAALFALAATTQAVTLRQLTEQEGELELEKGPTVNQIFQQYDKNQNNKLEWPEVKRAFIDLGKWAFKQADTDNSGFVSRQELKAALKAIDE